MKLNKLLILILIFVLAFRLFFVFQTENYSSDDSYFHLLYINNIFENKQPMLYDELSYGGRSVVYTPLFHYIMAVFSFIPGFLKILPATFISILVLISYLISKEIYDNKIINISIASLSGFIPIIFDQTLNQISPLSLLLPLSLLMLYSLMKIDKNKNYTILFIITALLMPFIHPASFIILLSVLLFLILANTESIKINPVKQEAVLFFSIFTLLVSFIIYKKAILLYGFDILRQNIPIAILNNYFSTLNLFESIFKIGLLSFVLGIIGIFYGCFKEKREHIILLSSLVLSVTALLLLKLINLKIGLMLLGIGLTLISTLTLAKLYKYLDITKFAKYKRFFFPALMILIVISAIIPSYFAAKDVIKKAPTNQELQELNSFRDLPFKTSILGSLEEGHLINYASGKKSIIDGNFLLAPKPTQRFIDVNIIYTTPFVTTSVDLLHQYKVKYIYLSDRTKELYDINTLKIAEDETCFTKVNNFYEVIC